MELLQSCANPSILQSIFWIFFFSPTTNLFNVAIDITIKILNIPFLRQIIKPSNVWDKEPKYNFPGSDLNPAFSFKFITNTTHPEECLQTCKYVILSLFLLEFAVNTERTIPGDFSWLQKKKPIILSNLSMFILPSDRIYLWIHFTSKGLGADSTIKIRWNGNVILTKNFHHCLHSQLSSWHHNGHYLSI